MPPLRKRKEDIPLLAEHFLRLSVRKLGRATPRLTLAAVQRLQQYDWPGNVRELQHVLERAVITSTGGRINLELPSSPSPTRVPEALIADADRVRTDAEIRQLEEVLGQQRDVFLPLAERGQLDGEHAKPVVQVLPEASGIRLGP